MLSNNAPRAAQFGGAASLIRQAMDLVTEA
jgi:tRNA-dihydrouridine synthase A